MLANNNSNASSSNSVAYNITNLLLTGFKDHNITIYGTWEEPLFKAKDIGDMLGIKDIKSTLRTFSEDEVHSMHLIDSIGRNQETNMLTETGLCALLGYV